jgi:hypothetical protein
LHYRGGQKIPGSSTQFLVLLQESKILLKCFIKLCHSCTKRLVSLLHNRHLYCILIG